MLSADLCVMYDTSYNYFYMLISVNNNYKKCVFSKPKRLNDYVLPIIFATIFAPPSRIENQFRLILNLDDYIRYFYTSGF